MFYNLSFDGNPSGYRDFRWRTLLAVASVEDKNAHLAGAKLLGRLSGEAWRATEHIPIHKLREDTGWTAVIHALDKHYRYLPETELHGAADNFLFSLKRHPHEGPTSFSSRFRTQLDRLQSLIAQECELHKATTIAALLIQNHLMQMFHLRSQPLQVHLTRLSMKLLRRLPPRRQIMINVLQQSQFVQRHLPRSVEMLNHTGRCSRCLLCWSRVI